MKNSAFDLISVIVPNYNHAKYLDKRMESLLHQTYPNLEIIVLDNCSTDNSLDVLANYKDRPGVKILALEKNGRYVHSCNLGVSLSHGKFIMFAESDDYNDPSHIDLLHKAMADNERIGVAFSRSFLVDASGRVLGDDFTSQGKSFKELCSEDALIPQPLIQRFFLSSCIIPNMSAALIRRIYFDLAGGFSPHYKACPDWDFWARISQCCDFYYLRDPLNNFRRHTTSAQRFIAMKLFTTEIMELLYTALRRADLTLWEQISFRTNIGVIWGSYGKKQPGIWWKSFPSIWRQSLKYDPLSLVFLLLGAIKRVVAKIKRS